MGHVNYQYIELNIVPRQQCAAGKQQHRAIGDACYNEKTFALADVDSVHPTQFGRWQCCTDPVQGAVIDSPVGCPLEGVVALLHNSVLRAITNAWQQYFGVTRETK